MDRLVFKPEPTIAGLQAAQDIELQVPDVDIDIVLKFHSGKELLIQHRPYLNDEPSLELVFQEVVPIYGFTFEVRGNVEYQGETAIIVAQHFTLPGI